MAMASPSSSAAPPLRCLQQANDARFGIRAIALPGLIPAGARARQRLQHRSLRAHGFPSGCSDFRPGMKKPTYQMIVKAQAGRKVRELRNKVVPDPDYRIPIVLLGGASALIYNENLLAAAPLGFLGLLLLFQTTRVRFVFDAEALEVKIGDQLQESEENVFVGGKNRWKYSSFVNWELWWPEFPVLVYFKETQTKPEGQVHFFPVIFNGKQLYDVMVERAGPSQNSLPK